MTISITGTSPLFSSNSLTALEIVQETLAEIGLPAPASLSGSGELADQARILLNSCGRDLREAYPWQFLTKEYEFATVIGTGSYDFPDDFHYLVVDSQWSATNVWPLLGPKNNQEWAYLRSGGSATGSRTRYRLLGNQLAIFPEPTAVETIRMDYVSACWVVDSAHATTLIDRVDNDDDRPILDSNLLKKLLKVKLLGSKGLDTSLAVQEFTLYMQALIERYAPNTVVQPDGVDVISISVASPITADNGMSALRIVQEAMAELDMQVPTTLVTYSSPAIQRALMLLNSAGRELVENYPWQFLVRTWEQETVDGQDAYALPADWAYAIDQSQWDETNHWPLLGPKTSQEWRYLKSGIVSSGPRIRYRLINNKFYVHPIPDSTVHLLTQDYVSACWVARDCPDDTVRVDQIVYDVDRPLFNSTLLKKLLKIKLVGGKRKVSDNGAVYSEYDVGTLVADFMDYYFKVTGKDTGATILSMAPREGAYLVGINNVVDGNWPI